MDSTSSTPLDRIMRGIMALLTAQREELRTELQAKLAKLSTRPFRVFHVGGSLP